MGGPLQAARREGDVWTVDACGSGPCRIRYRFPLRAVARASDDVDIATDERVLVESPPSAFLLAPRDMNPDRRLRLAVRTPPGMRFVTGLYASVDEPGTWEVARQDLGRAPYSAFGAMRVQEIASSTSRIQLAIGEGKLSLSDEAIAAWTRSSASAVEAYFGRFPLPSALLLVVPGRGRWVGEGRSLAGGGGTVFMRLGERAQDRDLASDWVLVHEMIHFAFPSVAVEHDWAEEGLATYVEPIVRMRAGLVPPEEAWAGLVRGLPNGLPGPGDQGLDRTPTWGRTYWGGALFWLLADIGIRTETNGARGLEHALRGLVAAGLTNATRRSLDDALRVADEAAGVTVLQRLHEAMGTSPHPVDLGKLFDELGIVRRAGRVTLDDAAPRASLRRAITMGR